MSQVFTQSLRSSYLRKYLCSLCLCARCSHQFLFAQGEAFPVQLRQVARLPLSFQLGLRCRYEAPAQTRLSLKSYNLFSKNAGLNMQMGNCLIKYVLIGMS